MGKLAPLPCERCGRDCACETLNYVKGLYICDGCNHMVNYPKRAKKQLKKLSNARKAGKS
jgi:hypothetical protein